MNALEHVDPIEKASQLSDRIRIIFILGQVHFLLFEGAHEPFGIAILPGRADLGNTDLDAGLPQSSQIGECGILNALPQSGESPVYAEPAPAQAHARSGYVSSASKGCSG